MNNTTTTQLPEFTVYSATDELLDYPYIGMGSKPKNTKILTDEQIENLIGG